MHSKIYESRKAKATYNLEQREYKEKFLLNFIDEPGQPPGMAGPWLHLCLHPACWTL